MIAWYEAKTMKCHSVVLFIVVLVCRPFWKCMKSCKTFFFSFLFLGSVLTVDLGSILHGFRHHSGSSWMHKIGKGNPETLLKQIGTQSCETFWLREVGAAFETGQSYPPGHPSRLSITPFCATKAWRRISERSLYNALFTAFNSCSL